MPTEDEMEGRKRRRAWWIASARRADPRHPKLADVAIAVGLKANSASTISDWENNQGGGPSLAQLERLAAFYALPVSLFTEPQPTEEEHLSRLRDLALAAVALESEDWQVELAGARAAPIEPAARPRTRSA
jgi:transcriptional regulator with XRE-family HTH domain